MKSKLSLIILGLGIVLLTTGMNGGCGESFYDITGYYYPNWLPNGRIIAVKSVEKYRNEGALPGWSRTIKISDAEYIVSMKDDGSDEEVIYGGENKSIGIIVASPLGNYIGYSSGQNIKIITADGTMEVKTIDCGETVNSFDWSPDVTRIVYAGDESRDMCVIDVSAETKTKIATNAAEVAWRVGEKIAYGYLYLIDPNGGNNVYLIDGGKPQIMNSGKILYYADLVSSGVYKIKSIYSSGTGESVVIDSYSRSTLKLSIDNTKIVGGDLGQRAIKGIWVANIDGTNLIKLRD